jgi:hypothetical protein
MGAMAFWGYQRALQANQTDYRPIAVAALMFMLTSAAVVAKVATVNPYAASDRTANRAMRSARDDQATLTLAADTALQAHTRAWRDLRAALREIQDKLQIEFIGTWETVILWARSLHGRTGDIPPALNGPRPPAAATEEPDNDGREQPRDNDADGSRSRLVDEEIHFGMPEINGVPPLFAQVPQPQPQLRLLEDTRDVLVECDPGPLVKRSDQVRKQLRTQIEGTRAEDAPEA